MQPIIPCLWFDGVAEEAANFYVSIFKDGKILGVTRYGEAGQEVHGQKPGTAMTVQFTINGQEFTGLNGGPQFKFSEAVSFQVMCDTQEEIDHYWEKMSAVPEAEQCGWLKDKFGVSWQIVPRALPELLSNPDYEKSQRVMAVMMQMHKLDIAALQQAANE